MNQHHAIMLISPEQEDAIRMLYKEKTWMCLLNVLSTETVKDIIQCGFVDVFPTVKQDDGQVHISRDEELHSENVETEKQLINERKTEEFSKQTGELQEESIDVGDYVSEEDSNDKSYDIRDSKRSKRIKSYDNKQSSAFKEKSNTDKVHKNVNRRVKCPLCDIELATKSILKRHCLRRHPDDWFEYKCADCTCMFKTQEELWKHRDEVKHKPPGKVPKQFDKGNHTPEELREMGHIQCKACGKFFHNDRMLRKHLYYAHRDMMPAPICAVCDTQFKTRQELWKHKKETNHNDRISLLKQYQCDSCGKILKGGYYSFVHHKKLACGKEQADLDELKVLPCDICGATFKTKHQIHCHKKAVHLDSPEVCDVCGHVYKNQMALKTHKKRHDEKNRKYSCNECGRSFFNSTLLKQHYRVHTKEKPFKCPLCNYTSACKENIGKHTLSVHKMKAKAIDLRKECDPGSTVTTEIKDRDAEINVRDMAVKDKHDLVFNSNAGENILNQNVPKSGTSFDVSTNSYIEMMNSDMPQQMYINTTIDPSQYQYPWCNPTTR